jgi:hypothetical protein
VIVSPQHSNKITKAIGTENFVCYARNNLQNPVRNFGITRIVATHNEMFMVNIDNLVSAFSKSGIIVTFGFFESNEF